MFKNDQILNLEYGNEGTFFPTHLDRDYLESDDPNMKRKVLYEIGILTRKMSQMKPHFYLNPQIDDELVYAYLRYCPEELKLLNKWIRFPNTNFGPQLAKAADKLAKYTTFNKDTVRLYRGFWHSNAKSRSNQKYAQQRLGLSEIQTEGSILKKSGSRFSYPLPKPISFTRSSHIANKFGTIVISTSLKNAPYKFIDDNDSLVAAVFINNGFFRIPKFYDHIKFLKEVIIIPDPNNTPCNFTITQTPVPLYFTPYDPEDYKRKESEKNENSGLYGSLYSMVLKVLGLDSATEGYNENAIINNTDVFDDGVLGNESLSSIKFGNIITQHEIVDKFGNAFLDLIKELKVSTRDYLMVAKTNSTDDIFQEKLVRRCLLLLKEFLNVLDEIAIRNGHLKDSEIENFTNKLDSIAKNMGFTDIRRTSQIKKEIEVKCTHGRVFELGYNLSTVSSILRTIDDLPINKIITSVSKVSIDSSSVNEKYSVLLSSVLSSSEIIVKMYESILNVLKRTYNPTKEYMNNKLEEKNKDKAEEGFWPFGDKDKKKDTSKKINNDVEKDKKAIAEAISIVTTEVNKYPSVKKCFSLTDKKEHSKFLNGEETYVEIGYCSIEKGFTEEEINNHDDLDSNDPLEKYYDQVDRLEEALHKKKILNGQYSFDTISDWDYFGIDIVRNKSALKKGNESLSLVYKDSLALYKKIAYSDFDKIGEEGFTSFITRALTGILNLLLRIINNVKAIIKRPIADLQRTELHKFVNDHKVTMMRILSVKYSTLVDLIVPSPVGMIKPYKVTSEAISNTLNIMKMDERVSDALVSVKEITDALSSGNTINMRNNRVNLGDIKSFESVYKKSTSCFNPGLRNQDKRFDEVFPSDHCLKEAYEILDKGVEHEYCVSQVFKTLEKLYAQYELILNLVSQENASITKNDLMILSEQTTTLAKMFDMYGITINDLQSVEHNFVLVLYAIKKHLDL